MSHRASAIGRRAPLVVLASLALLPAVGVRARPRVPDERMAAYHQTILAVRESSPVACLQTYVRDRQTWTESYGLAKLVVGVRVGGRTMWVTSADRVSVEDVPGGVQYSWRTGRLRVDCRWMALPVGRAEGAWEGVACLTVSAPGADAVLVRIGGGHLIDFPRPRSAWLAAAGISGHGDTAAVVDSKGVLASDAHPLSVRVAGPGLVAEPEATGGSHLLSRSAGGTASILVAYAKDPSRALALSETLPAQGARAAGEYYRQLLLSRIETPEPAMDAAFRSAILTLDYNWVAPYGWNECIHHWMSMWHMQHSPAEELLGHPDRSRASLLSHIERLMPSGAAPQLAAGGFPHRDFGGSNQFTAWQMRHYWEQTGDRTVLKPFADALDRIIRQTWEENDEDGNGLLGWGQQIGNQEDYVSSPHDATTPTIEGLQMLETRRLFADALGDADTVGRLGVRMAAIRSALRERLWLDDLGRFAFFRPSVGSVRYEGQYHTYLYPAIYGIGSIEEQWMGGRHFRDRLVGNNGAAYVSNAFPWHAGGTWGMQAGVAQQPWAADGLAALGLSEEAYRPLRAAARWAMDLNHRGSWPEIATESTPAYFSPPAGLYVQHVVESLFGLRRSAPTGTLTVAPRMPASWHCASVLLPGLRATFRATGQVSRYDVWTARPLRQFLSVVLPSQRVVGILANGRPVAWTTVSRVNCLEVRAQAPPGTRVAWTIQAAPRIVALSYRRSVGEGEWLTLRPTGGRIVGLRDPCGVTDASRLGSDGSADVRIRRGLLSPWVGFGRVGLANFARRSLFVAMATSGTERQVRSVDITVVPRHEVAAGSLTSSSAGAGFSLTLRSNCVESVNGATVVQVGQVVRRVPVHVGAHTEVRQFVALGHGDVALLSPGDNRGCVTWPDGDRTPFVLDSSDLFAGTPALAQWAGARLETVPLPEDRLKPDVAWRDWRRFLAAGHMPWASAGPPLASLADDQGVPAPGLPGKRLGLSGRKAVPLSRKMGSPSLVVPMDGKACCKVYAVVLPLLDNHDTFCRVGSVSCRVSDGSVVSRDLYFPGTLDWFWPRSSVGDFATVRPRPGRLALEPRLAVRGVDYPWARPPLFPDPTDWSSSRTHELASGTLTLVEVDLGHPVSLADISVQVDDPEASLAVLGITIERATGHAALENTPWQPGPGNREPQLLFRFASPGDAAGWKLGPAFSVSAEPRLFSSATLNSLCSQGEIGVGEATSPDFTISAPFLRARLQGGRQLAGAPLALRVVSADDRSILASVTPAGTHVLQEVVLDLHKHLGRKARLVLIDGNPGSSYAWIGLADVWLAWR